VQPSLHRRNSLRGEKKKQTSPSGAISGSNGWLALRRLRQSHLFGSRYPVGLCSKSSEKLCLSAAGGGANCRSKNLCTAFGRVGSSCAHGRTAGRGGGLAELWYRGAVGPIARVYGPGGASVRPRRRVATRVSIVSGIEKKDTIFTLVLSISYIIFTWPRWPLLRARACGFAARQTDRQQHYSNHNPHPRANVDRIRAHPPAHGKHVARTCCRIRLCPL
jgi:hypothetical protein